MKTIILWGLLTAVSQAAEVPLGGIGFRGDGTGIFPPDCKPPTKFDGATGENLVWKTPLPNFGSSSPVVVGRKVFVTCAPGWPEGQDCIVLLCFDADTGKEVWRRDLDELATLAPEQAKEAREVRKEFYQRIRRINVLRQEYKIVQAKLEPDDGDAEGASTRPAVTGPKAAAPASLPTAQRTAEEKRRVQIVAELAALNVPIERVSTEDGRWGAGSAQLFIYADRNFGPRMKKLCGHEVITWGPTCLDVAMPTPLSDGKRIYVYTGLRSVHALDLDGNMLWQVRQLDAPHPGHWPEDLANRPTLIDGKLLMHCFEHLWAYELETGQLAWKVESKHRFRHGMGSPAMLRLKGPGGGTDAFLYLWTGDLVRLRDGKLMGKDIMYSFFPSMVSDGGDTLYISTMSEGAVEYGILKGKGYKPQIPPEGPRGTRALRFAYDGPDKVVWKELWHNDKVSLGDYPFLVGHRLITGNALVLDGLTGESGAVTRRSTKLGTNGAILAGGHFYGMGPDGIGEGSGGASGLGIHKDNMAKFGVARLGEGAVEPAKLMNVEVLPATITEPAKRAQVVAITGLDRHRRDYGWHSSYSTAFASGNRLFIRTYNYLYCFGDKTQPFVPSKAFDGGE